MPHRRSPAVTTMIWLTPDGEYLVQGPAASLPEWPGSIHGPDGDPVQPAKFYLVTPGGEVSQAFSEPLQYSVDDERGLTNIHAVTCDSLVSYHVIDHVLLGVRIVSRVVIAGLTPAQAGRTPAALSGAIAAHEKREQAERGRREV